MIGINDVKPFNRLIGNNYLIVNENCSSEIFFNKILSASKSKREYISG